MNLSLDKFHNQMAGALRAIFGRDWIFLATTNPRTDELEFRIKLARYGLVSIDPNTLDQDNPEAIVQRLKDEAEPVLRSILSPEGPHKLTDPLLEALRNWRYHWTNAPCSKQPCNHHDCHLAIVIDQQETPMPMKPKRLQYRIVPWNRRWALFAQGYELPLHDHRTKAWLVKFASSALAAAWKTLKIRSELTIHHRSGNIQDRRTYGEDPVETKG